MALPASCQQQRYVLTRAPDFNWVRYEKAIGRFPEKFFTPNKIYKKATRLPCTARGHLLKHEGGGRGRQKRGVANRNGEERKKRERMSTAEVSLQCKILMARKKLFQKVPERLKTSLCIMPMKQVSTSLFELDQDDKNRETKWWKPLISSSASPHAKGRLLKAPGNYTNTPNEIR